MEPTGDSLCAHPGLTALKRHNLCDNPTESDFIRFFCNERLAQGRPEQDGTTDAMRALPGRSTLRERWKRDNERSQLRKAGSNRSRSGSGVVGGTERLPLMPAVGRLVLSPPLQCHMGGRIGGTPCATRSQRRPRQANTSMSEQRPHPIPLIEVGWVVVGRVDDATRTAMDQARQYFQTSLQQTCAPFTWHVPQVQREDVVLQMQEEVVGLLEYGITELRVKHWDFAFVIAGAELRSYYKPYALGASSRSVNVAIMSTVRSSRRHRTAPPPLGASSWHHPERGAEGLPQGEESCAYRLSFLG